MIIKTAGEEGSWRFYDNAREVQHSWVTEDQALRVDGLSAEDNAGVSVEVDGVVMENNLDISVPVPTRMYLCLSFYDHLDRPRQLYLNRETYLLNDSGKTIEKLF